MLEKINNNNIQNVVDIIIQHIKLLTVNIEAYNHPWT